MNGMIIVRSLFLFLCLMLIPGHASAQMPLNVPARLEAETNVPAPGKIVTLAFVMQPKPGWHGYWENPGDAGFGMTLKWDLPKGVTVGKLRYPVPDTLLISGLMNYVFENQHVLLVDLAIDPALVKGTPVPVRFHGEWLGCTDKVCVPQQDDFVLDMVVGDGAVTATQQARFDKFRAAMPVPLDRNGRYQISGEAIEIAIPYPANAPLQRPYFFPLGDGLFEYKTAQSARRVGDELVIKATVNAGSTAPIEGVLRFDDGQGLLVKALPGNVPSGGTAVVNENAQAQVRLDDSVPGGILGLLVFAVLGGLILNLMPCVFPILGLKALALAKAGGDENAARRDALAYSAGVILSCLVLGALLLTLRAAGMQVGWAFQLQEPAIVFVLALLMVGVTANLAGLFEVSAVTAGGSLANKSGAAGSFWTGVLAAVVATPCTGPFMAAAMGAALLLPVLPALLLFAGLGLGLALPFVAIAFIPALRGLLPKPGPWLGRFRAAMAIPMALTAIALLWLLSRLTGWQGLAIGLLATFTVLGLLWQYGRIQAKGEPAQKWMLAVLGAAVIGGSVFFANMVVSPQGAVHSGILKSEAFSQATLAKYRANGTPVFVYFTADWCVTCKVNEAAAIERDETVKAFRAHGIKVLRGDFTRRDPAIARFLLEHGRSGVPLYLFYAKGTDARILPQILTPATMAALR
jgi:thiol:disulfide interchange protein/DsbC/DsbD-like thiol-disulfide interchange protein